MVRGATEGDEGLRGGGGKGRLRERGVGGRCGLGGLVCLFGVTDVVSGLKLFARSRKSKNVCEYERGDIDVQAVLRRTRRRKHTPHERSRRYIAQVNRYFEQKTVGICISSSSSYPHHNTQCPTNIRRTFSALE